MKNFMTANGGKKLIVRGLIMSMLVLPLATVLPAEASMNPNWNVTGNYVVNFQYQGSDNMHDVSLVQDSSGNLTGNGGNPAGAAHTYTWELTSGMVSGNSIEFDANYTATADAVVPQTVMHVMGAIANDGSMSGTWTDNYQGGNREGTWTSTTGNAVLLGSLSAQDFGVVNYDSGQGQLAGYTAGFGLTNATFEGAQSVVVKLYSGTTLLQTNTSTSKFATDIIGDQFSSPFDVSGNFNYVADGYWTNAREGEYGQSLAATKVIAEVTLANGKSVTAENTNLTGDGSTVFPVSTVKVTIEKYIDGAKASAESAKGLDFPMSATWNAQNIGAGSGEYTLSSLGFNGDPTPYQAITVAMSSGADYSTNEITSGAVVGTTCSTGQPFMLAGYSTGNTQNDAVEATATTSIPSLTNITSDKYIIVHNMSCPNENSTSTGQIGGVVIPGDGALKVDSITVIKSTSTADSTFAGGWKYDFRITMPNSEPKLSMKFANWISADSLANFATANNMRISSGQANNSGATVLITAANLYSAPALNMVTDLDPVASGRQVDVIVEVAVPIGTTAGSYSTFYGVQTNP